MIRFPAASVPSPFFETPHELTPRLSRTLGVENGHKDAPDYDIHRLRLSQRIRRRSCGVKLGARARSRPGVLRAVRSEVGADTALEDARLREDLLAALEHGLLADLRLRKFEDLGGCSCRRNVSYMEGTLFHFLNKKCVPKDKTTRRKTVGNERVARFLRDGREKSQKESDTLRCWKLLRVFVGKKVCVAPRVLTMSAAELRGLATPSALRRSWT